MSDVRQDSDGLFQLVRVELSVDPSQIEEVLFLPRNSRAAVSARMNDNEDESQSFP